MHYTTPTTDENIDQRVAEWHDTWDSRGDIPLIEWLGLTFDDYGHWVTKGTLPKQLTP